MKKLTGIMSKPQDDGSELIFALVGAIGTDLDSVSKELETSLKRVNFNLRSIRVIELMHGLKKWKTCHRFPEDKRYNKHMDAGNEFRLATERYDALALLAIGQIRDHREKITGDPNKSAPRQAYLLRSLKNPKEAQTLRRIYNSRFNLIAAYSPRDQRLQCLAQSIAESYHAYHSDEYRAKAESLMQRDEVESDKAFGQNVSTTFPQADVFINASDRTEIKKSIDRFLELLFGNTFHTPTREEYGMFHAQAAALRSSTLSRQVGSIISTEDGDLIAAGCNEVPKAQGGLYWAGDTPDQRDFRLGYDTSTRRKKNLLADILKRLQDEKWLKSDKSTKDIDKLIDEAVAGHSSPLIPGAQIMNVLAFGRAVHAEMAALMDAARRGISVKGCLLYTTTFPCHDCARHIVAAGIQKVIYIEPYPQSLAQDLHYDSIIVDSLPEGDGRVKFKPFVGIAPRRYMDLFTMTKRKEDNGSTLNWDQTKAKPRLSGVATSYLVPEAQETSQFIRTLKTKKLITATD